MTRSDTDTDAPASDADELPEHRCVEIADETGERCRNAAIPIADRCHAHVDYAALAESTDHRPIQTPPKR